MVNTVRAFLSSVGGKVASGILGAFMLAVVLAGGASAQTPAPSDIVPSTWTFSDLTGAIAAIAAVDLIQLTFFGLLGLAVLMMVARKVKGLVKSGR